MRGPFLKSCFIFLLFFALSYESFAGIITSAGFGFGRYRNQFSPSEMSQPAGLAWNLSAGYKLFFVSEEVSYLRLSACTDNLYKLKEYETCATDSIIAFLSRIYIGSMFNIIVGYGFHNVTHKLTPDSTEARDYFHYNYENKNRGLAYGIGGNMNLLAGLDAYFDFILFAIGNGGDKPSSEVDTFLVGLRYEL